MRIGPPANLDTLPRSRRHPVPAASPVPGASGAVPAGDRPGPIVILARRPAPEDTPAARIAAAEAAARYRAADALAVIRVSPFPPLRFDA